jgi:hypothetical protein
MPKLRNLNFNQINNPRIAYVGWNYVQTKDSPTAEEMAEVKILSCPFHHMVSNDDDVMCIV